MSLVATIICFTALCVQMSTTSIDEKAMRMSQLRYLAKSVKLTRQKIVCFVDKMKLTQERDLNDILYRATNNAIFTHANPALQEVRNAVEIARSQGRNSSYCYGIATYLMEDKAKYKYKYGVIPCMKNFTSAVEELISQAKPIRGALREVQAEFKDSLWSCNKFNESVQCSGERISELREKYECLKGAGVELMKDSEEFYPKLVRIFDACITLLAAEIEETATYLRRHGVHCAQSGGISMKRTEKKRPRDRTEK